jgi:ABC-2 type transport system ATP-binding protein
LSPASPIVEASGVVKTFGAVTALADLNLRVAPGEIFGLLGPNGAGKTTTLRILSGLESPTRGSVRVVGCDPVSQRVEVKRRTGYVAEAAVLYESLTPREYFEFVISTRMLEPRSKEKVARLAAVFDIGTNLDVPIGALSLGTKQKISVIAAMVHDPPLLLDEPLNGLDAKSSRILKELISIHVEKGGAAIF